MTGDILFVVFISFLCKLAYAAGQRDGMVTATSVLLDSDDVL